MFDFTSSLPKLNILIFLHVGASKIVLWVTITSIVYEIGWPILVNNERLAPETSRKKSCYPGDWIRDRNIRFDHSTTIEGKCIANKKSKKLKLKHYRTDIVVFRPLVNSMENDWIISNSLTYNISHAFLNAYSCTYVLENYFNYVSVEYWELHFYTPKPSAKVFTLAVFGLS